MMNLLVFVHKADKCKDYITELLLLSKKVKLIEFVDLSAAIRIVKQTHYKLVVFLTFEQTFPENWNVHKLKFSSPLIALAGADRISFTSLISLIDMVAQNQEPSCDNRLFAESLAFIDENLCENDLNLEKVASTIFVSRCHYSRMFQKYVGTGFKEYVMNKRIQKAKLLLQKGEPVTDVCFSVGYNDLTHFGRVFKRKVGVNPSVYRLNRAASQ
ncbi:helix-turn-helix transcriptional regulator [Paenibacillus sp. FJAT-26967]|uniref:helix-turn-helix transcriptional regulator n=1 Tax=Paenibacillus sp. FJAT-26967 TaxID=1729690 RepID=UPI0020A2B1A8|nr:helix-turn-helix transcriptional regulator [Paenibacillus sp. FJAT-26967]